jgi:hypothetical protein
MAKYNITHKYLLSILDYNPKTGVFVWRERPAKYFDSEGNYKTWNKRFAGKQAGFLHSSGYIRIKLNLIPMNAHILAYFYVHKKWPVLDIDHYDKNRSNNKIKNLREATDTQNGANRKISKNNKLGLKGVCLNKNKYRAQIYIDYKQIYLGSFHTPEEAHAAYCKAARELFGDFASFD